MRFPEYRSRLETGIVHFGPGAFHRAHQADYIDRLLHHDARWGIAGVSLRTGGTIDALRRQDGLYTLAIRDTETSFRTIGAHSRFLGLKDAAAIRRQLQDPAVRIITITVTEKGYCLSGDGTLDMDHPEIVHDLAQPLEPASIVGWLALGLADRRAQGLLPFVPLCCDNMTSNGKKVGAAVEAFARCIDAELGRWIQSEVCFPDTVVDSITPATDERLRTLVRQQTGFDDEVPVSREAYAEWVIEDVLPAPVPDLASVGVRLTNDVAGWEKAKLRILNGAHSTLAYLGLLGDHETVADAMGDQGLATFVERLVKEDVVPTLGPSTLDLHEYVRETLQRFRNAAINHRLSQIAWDGSQKLPYRLLDTIEHALAAGRSIGRLVMPVAAWILFIERRARTGVEIVDPLAPHLVACGFSSDPVGCVLELRQVFPERVATDQRFRDALNATVNALRIGGSRALAEIADA